MTLPYPAAASIVPDNFDLADEPPVDYQPTKADLEAIFALNLDAFLPRKLEFCDWLSEKSRQLSLLDDDRSRWLSAGLTNWRSSAFSSGPRSQRSSSTATRRCAGRTLGPPRLPSPLGRAPASRPSAASPTPWANCPGRIPRLRRPCGAT